MKRFTLALAGLLFVVACQDQSTSPPPPVTAPSFDISDGATGGNPHFFFLPPVAAVDPSPTGIFNPALEPVVQFCKLDASGACAELLAEFTLTSGSTEHRIRRRNGFYVIGWQNPPGVVVGDIVRVTVFAGGTELGFADILVVPDGGPGEAGGDAGADVVGGTVDMPRSSTLAVRFIIEVGALSGCTADCVEQSVPPGGGQVTLTDPGGTVLATGTFPSGWSAVTRVVSVECNDLSFPAGQGPLNTALDQWPLFCQYNVFPALAPGETFLLPVTVGICQVDDNIVGQPPFHGFDRPNMRMGKGAAPEPFEILPPAAPSGLGACANVVAMDALEAPGFLGEVMGRLAAAVRLLGPEPLRASGIVRDGGVGGLATSFSRFNAVELSTIEGTVSGPGGPIAGATVTLSGDASASTTTAADGTYSFALLDVGSYTVTLTPTMGLDFGPLDRPVTITGTEVVIVDFVGVVPGPVSLLSCPASADPTKADNITRGFYVPSFPGSRLDRVELQVHAVGEGAADTYTLSLTARSGAYNGPVLGSSQVVVDLAGFAENVLAGFDFPGVAVTPGSVVTFDLRRVSGGESAQFFQIRYNVGGFPLGPSDSDCDVVQTNSKDPLLDVLRRNGIGIEILGQP